MGFCEAILLGNIPLNKFLPKHFDTCIKKSYIGKIIPSEYMLKKIY